MAREQNPFERNAEQQRVEPRAIRTPKVPNADNPAPSRQGKRGMSIYFDVDTHRALKELAHVHERSIDSFIREGVNLMFQHYGKKPIA